MEPIAAASVEVSTTHPTSSSRPPVATGPPALDTLPEEVLVKIVSFCNLGDVFRLRCSCKALSHVLDRPTVVEGIVRRIMDYPRPANGVIDRDVLIQLIKIQVEEKMIRMDLGDESKKQDFQRNVFLCLAVTLPPRQRTRVKEALGPFLAKAQIIGSGRDPGDDHGGLVRDGADPQLLDTLLLHDNCDDFVVVAAEVERRIGIISTLLVLGYWDICDFNMGQQLMAINHWSIKSNIWAERKLLQHKDISLQLAFTMALGLLNPTTNWSTLQQSGVSEEYRTLTQQVRADYRGAGFSTPSSQSFWLSWEGIHTRSLQLAGLIAYQLKISGLDDIPRADLLSLLIDPKNPLCSNAATSDVKNIPQPTTLCIPLLENFSADGIRAQSTSWQAWYTSRVRDMVESIDDGEWYGYYVYTLDNNSGAGPYGVSHDLRSSTKDPAMERVFFKLGGETSTAKTLAPSVRSFKSSNCSTATTASGGQKLPLVARGGRDGVTAEFDFVGTVGAHTGIVSMQKNYRGAHSWDYDGVMTPLGIVGEWGREGAQWDGYFWLWKRSWMAKDAVQRTFAYA